MKSTRRITGLGARPPKPPTGATPMREFGKTGLNYFDCVHPYWDGHSEEVYGDVRSDVRFAQRFKPLAAEEKGR